MRRLIQFILLLLVFMTVPFTVHARILEGDGSQRETGFIEQTVKATSSKWEALKTRVVSWWQGSRAPAAVSETAQIPAPAAAKPSDTSVATGTASVAVPKPSADVQVLTAQLPSYNTAEVRSQNQSTISNNLKLVKEKKALVVAEPARPADPKLAKNKAGVAVYNIGKVKEIPALNVGREARVTREEWEIQSLSGALNEFAKIKALESPALVSESEVKTALGPQVEKVTDAKNLKVSAFGPDGRVNMETVRKVTWAPKPDTLVQEKPTKDLSADELKILRAQILLESGKKCHLAAGLLYELLDSSQVAVKTEANYHLSLCLHKMGLFTESTRRMKDVLRNGDKDQVQEAIKLLTVDLPLEFEEEIAAEFKRLDVANVPAESRDGFYFILAKGLSRQGQFEGALSAADKVSGKFKKYPEVQFVAAVSEYALNRNAKALERFRNLKKHIDQNGGDSHLRSLVSINLARMAFQDKAYQEAIENYHEIKKDHPLWVDALIELGWTQLQLGDASGAIGNMYSIHSPYFKSVYQPESFVVRTIGYLNICQYGDAYRTLTQLEQSYRGWMSQMQTYRQKSKPLDFYSSMIKYLKAPTSQQGVDGLPFQVLREAGRHKDFLNLQQAVNNRVDEVEQYGFLAGLIQKEKNDAKWLLKKSQERLADLKSKVKKAETNPAFAKDLNLWKSQKRNEENVQETLAFVLRVMEESQTQFGRFQKSAVANVQKRKAELQVAAGEVLKTRVKKLEVALGRILENNELLRYETFAGSGENIRFHATATGESAKIAEKRMPRTAKPETKALQWEFDGEFWEDEIGHYRSSLKNNCPENRAVSAR